MSQVFNFVNSLSSAGSCSSSGGLRAACEQGSMFNPTIFIVEDCSGDPVDLTGCTVKMQVRPAPGSSTLILTISTLAGNVTIDGPRGAIAINVPASVTATLVPGLYVYDMDLTESGGGISRLIEGKFEITPEVTT